MFFKKQKSPERTARIPGARRIPSHTGSTPARSQVFSSYHANRSQRPDSSGRVTPDQAERVQEWRERLKWLRSTPLAVLFVVIVVVVSLILHLDSHPSVVPLEEAKGQVFLRSLKTYEDAVHDIFRASLFNGNKLTVNAAQISEDIKKQFPELRTASISLPLIGSKPVVYIQPAIPALVLSAASNELYIVDTSGKALMTGNQVPDIGALKLPVLRDESGIPIKPGSLALPDKSVSFITEVIGQLKAKQIPISTLTLPAGASELQVRVEKVPYYIRFNLHGNAREEAGAYLATKQKLEQERKTPGTYVDVRVPGKVYFK